MSPADGPDLDADPRAPAGGRGPEAPSARQPPLVRPRGVPGPPLGAALPLPRHRRARAGGGRPAPDAPRHRFGQGLLPSGAPADAHHADARGHGPPPAVRQGPPGADPGGDPRAHRAAPGCPGRGGRRTRPSERSHVATRDRLRASRGLNRVRIGQRFLEGLEALQALRGGRIDVPTRVPGYPPTGASPHETARAVVAALQALSARLTKRASSRPVRG
jgi:hypothetical protein